MPIVHALPMELFEDFVSLDELSILTSKRHRTITNKLHEWSVSHVVRTIWRPTDEEFGAGEPCFKIEDVKEAFGISDDYAEELSRFRRRALGKRITIPLV